MPATELILVKLLSLDLDNFRTVPQKDEQAAVHAMVVTDPQWFWALTESLINEGYHPTENIIILRKSSDTLTVKEGNRRIGALKLILGFIDRSQLNTPSSLEEQIKGLTSEWKRENQKVPCAVYEAREKGTVDRIITLTHGKGEQAGRRKWNPVARARHNREANGSSEPGLDLLEKYLVSGTNLTKQQGEKWAGVYPLTILDEAIRKLAPRLELASAREFAYRYPTSIRHKIPLDNIIKDIGLELISFDKIRNEKEDFSNPYGIPALTNPIDTTIQSPTAIASSNPTNGSQSSLTPSVSRKEAPPNSKKPRALALDDPKSVYKELKRFEPKGANRQKVVVLLLEIKTLQLHKHPHAFCFLLRSMFEISAKAYCKDHSAMDAPKFTKPNGEDRHLVDVLRDITNHLTQNGKDQQLKKALHGALTQLAKPEGILSVTSMNQLVHNPKFSIKESDICVLFHNIFPLMEAMNS